MKVVVTLCIGKSVKEAIKSFTLVTYKQFLQMDLSNVSMVLVDRMSITHEQFNDLENICMNHQILKWSFWPNNFALEADDVYQAEKDLNNAQYEYRYYRVIDEKESKKFKNSSLDKLIKLASCNGSPVFERLNAISAAEKLLKIGYPENIYGW